MSGWFYTQSGFVNDHTIGPIDKKEITRLISIRKLQKNAIVCHPVETNNEWVRLCDSPLFEIYERFHMELTQKATAKKREKKQQRRKKQQEIVVAKQEKRDAKQKQRAQQLSSQNKRRATTSSNDKRTNRPANMNAKPLAAQAKKDYPYLSQYLRIAEILVDVTHGISFVILFGFIIFNTYNLIQVASSGLITAEFALLWSVIIIVGSVLSFYIILWSRIISFAFLEFVGVIINMESNTRK